MSRRPSARLVRLAKAQRSRAELAASEHDRIAGEHRRSLAEADAILAALNADSPWHGLLLGTMARALTQSGRESHALSEAAATASAKRTREELCADLCDRRAAKARKLERRRREAAELEAILAARLGAQSASSSSAARSGGGEAGAAQACVQAAALSSPCRIAPTSASVNSRSEGSK